MPTTISFIIPALNEEATIGKTINKIPRKELENKGFSVEVLVVNNNSNDGTASQAKAHGAMIIDEQERGYGKACNTGFKSARGDILILSDGDASYPLEHSYDIIKPILEERADLVLGSRFKGEIKKGAMGFLRKCGNIILTFQLNVLYSTGISDAHSGFRAIRREAFEKLTLKQPGMEYSSEFIVESSKKKLRIMEIPIEYFPRISESKSKLRPIRDGFRHFIYLLKAKF